MLQRVAALAATGQNESVKLLRRPAPNSIPPAASIQRAHYGIAPRRLVAGWPGLSSAHNAAYYTIVNQTGLVKAWHFWAHTLTQAGRWFAAASLAFFAVGSASLDIQVFVPLCYAASLWLCALLALHFFRPRLTLRARHVDRIGVGQSLPIEFDIENRGRTLSDARILPHLLPPEIAVSPPDGALLPDLARGEKGRVRFHLQPSRRGVFEMNGFRGQTSAPFGLLHAARLWPQASSLVVYPNFTPLSRVDLPVGRGHHPGGVALAASRGDSFEFWGSREWREGDSQRDIDWRATARLRRPAERPIVREYREEWLLRAAVVLDTQAATPAKQEDFECAVSLCAGVADWMARQDYLVDIFAAGPQLHHLTAGRSLAYLDQILDILARVECDDQSPFQTLEPEIAAYLSQITSIVCIFVDWNDERQNFVRHLEEQGAAVKIVVACDEETAAEAASRAGATVLSRDAFEAGVVEL